ncbi:MAG: 3-phosphoshikimate 1-carboxyvinyltransferase [Solirubrobacterales bacterium]
MTRFAPPGPLSGVLSPPPDKSISHRAALIAAMGEGEAEVDGYLDAADTRATLEAIEGLGAKVTEVGDGVRIRGVGLRGAGEAEIDVANAGTLLRMLPGWLAGQGAGSWTLDGDESIRRRPVDRVAEPLRLMGADVECREGRLPPLRVNGAALHGIDYRLPVASAQVKSCVLLAGLLAEGETAVTEPATTRDHTERILRAAGAEVESVGLRTTPITGGPAARIAVQPAERLRVGRLRVPGDFSSAAFHLVAATIVPRSAVRLERVGLNPTRVGLLGILNRMGAAIEVEEEPADGGEPHGAIVARHSKLTATRVHPEEVPVAIDELPLVALLGCFADGRTVVSGAGELRHKESDRIASVVDGLRAVGAEIEATEDGFVVEGTGGVRGGTLDPRGDHRLAMLGAVAGLGSQDGVEVDMGAAAVSYPGFEADLASLAARG